MLSYDKAALAEKARELSVVRDTLEKVYRLKEVLRFFDESAIIRDNLALKGGTAINLLFFNMPRLSVDIDLDFCQNLSKDEMLLSRQKLTALIDKYMTAEGYHLSPKSKSPHSLDSLVYNYTNNGGMRDNIKIEINYSLRAHVLPIRRIKFQSDILEDSFGVNTLSPAEIYATKTVALLTRAAARDLYDLNHMAKSKMFSEHDIEDYRRCVIFYLAIASDLPRGIDFSVIDTVTPHKVKTDLNPVIRDYDSFNLNEAQKVVYDFLHENLYMKDSESLFFEEFRQGSYHPELLFEEPEILERIASHPMALWKTRKR